MKRKHVLASVGGLLAIIIGWFLAVDCSWFEETCPACHEACSVIEYRICGYCVRKKIHVTPSVIQQVSAELGVPCSHPKAVRWHKIRWWGLLWCSCPCINGIVGLAGDAAWYERNLADKVKTFRINHPDISAEFQQRVLVDHDQEYWQELLKEIESSEHRSQ